MRRKCDVPESTSSSDMNLNSDGVAAESGNSDHKGTQKRIALNSELENKERCLLECSESSRCEESGPPMSLYVNDASATAVSSDDDLLLGASASPTGAEGGGISGDGGGDCDHCSRCSLAVADLPPSISECLSMARVEPAENDGCNYVGLVNQAMTCYLNSLVQALYMTPEFRNAIYNWEFDGVNETRSIPYQLQRLFLNLQTSTRSAVETTDLTTSFGWQGSEAWHQHDIQELCRVMFDALEFKFKDTKQANLINDLYEGKMLDYVKCLECSTEKSREDTFLDIPLPVKPFGNNVAYNSVEEALRAFVQPETLEGNNQYFCEKCNKKCDAHKGLKFMKFPYLLTLHLKRFDFDYNTMHRIKLNDKVVFPERLNLNSFVPTSTDSEHIVEDYNASNLISSSRDAIIRCDECSTTDSGSALDDESCHGTDLSSVTTVNEEDSDEGIDVSSGGNNSDEPKGPYNYELFSIMIHSGSASGGHYYAYIKDFDRNQWLCFNDQSVTRITGDDIKKTYGGGGAQKAYYSGVYASSTNAYMLMYRQIDKNRNCTAIQMEQFPPHVQKLLEQMRNQENMERQKREKQNNSYRLNVYCFHPLTDELMDIRMNMLPDANLKQAVQMAHRRFKLEGLVDVDDCRMVAYNKKQFSVECSFEEEQNFCDINVNTFFSDWLFEIKQPDAEFQIYKMGSIDMRTYYVDIEADDVREPIRVRVNANETVKSLKGKLSELLGVSVYNMKIAITKLYGEPQYLDSDDQFVPFDNHSSEFKMYVANIPDEETDKELAFSKFKNIVHRFHHILYLNVLIPDTDPATLENVFGPSLDMIPNCGDGTNNCRLIENIDRTNSPSLLRVSPQHCAMNCTDAFGDQSNSEDSSLSDSDRTLVGEAPGQGIFSSNSTSPADQHMISPMDPPEDNYNYDILGNPSDSGAVAMSWENSTPANNSIASAIQNVTYFKVLQYRDCRRNGGNCVAVGSYSKVCKVFIDNRMNLDEFKKHLESVLRIPKEYFKVFKQYPTPDDEWITLSETLRFARDAQTFTVKLGRTLSSNEYSCKIYLLKPGSTDTNNFLFEHIISKGQSVAHAKKEILFKAKKQHMLDISFNKSRLREKCLKKPRKVYLDDQLFADDILMLNNTEFYLQELGQPERVTSTNQLVLFSRHWEPSTLTLHPFEEVILDTSSMNELKNKVSDMSQIPLEYVQVAFVRNIFPCEMHLLDIQSVLDWEAKCGDQNLSQIDDGTTFFYRDSRETPKELSYEEKKEINIKENTRLGRMSAKSCATWEKPLRIHLDNWPSENEDNCID